MEDYVKIEKIGEGWFLKLYFWDIFFWEKMRNQWVNLMTHHSAVWTENDSVKHYNFTAGAFFS